MGESYKPVSSYYNGFRTNFSPKKKALYLTLFPLFCLDRKHLWFKDTPFNFSGVSKLLHNKTPAKHRDNFKILTLQHGFEPMTSCLPRRRTTNWGKVTRIWGNKVAKKLSDFVKKRNTDYDFPFPYTNKFVGVENSNTDF